MHHTRGTRIRSEGLQSPLEVTPPHRETWANKGSICGYNMLDPFLRPLLFEHWREAHSPDCVEGKFSELRRAGVLGGRLPNRPRRPCCADAASLRILNA